MDNGNESAYPSQRLDVSGTPREDLQRGLTKREYFAAMAMQGMTSNNSITVETVAAWAVQYADALLAELGKEGK